MKSVSNRFLHKSLGGIPKFVVRVVRDRLCLNLEGQKLASNSSYHSLTTLLNNWFSQLQSSYHSLTTLRRYLSSALTTLTTSLTTLLNITLASTEASSYHSYHSYHYLYIPPKLLCKTKSIKTGMMRCKRRHTKKKRCDTC